MEAQNIFFYHSIAQLMVNTVQQFKRDRYYHTLAVTETQQALRSYYGCYQTWSMVILYKLLVEPPLNRNGYI